jgi:acylphosphatase
VTHRAVDVRVTGVVQGVWFRAGCADQAGRLGVSGWVTNEPDGSVSGHFEGGVPAIEALLAWCREGAPRAQVDEVLVADAELTGVDGFSTR